MTSILERDVFPEVIKYISHSSNEHKRFIILTHYLVELYNLLRDNLLYDENETQRFQVFEDRLRDFIDKGCRVFVTSRVNVNEWYIDGNHELILFESFFSASGIDQESFIERIRNNRFCSITTICANGDILNNNPLVKSATKGVALLATSGASLSD